MFIDEKILIRLMKDAYKGSGVYIGRFDGWYVIAAGYWTASMAVGCVSNKVLAAIVELSGQLPEDGEAWTADKGKNQLEGYDHRTVEEPRSDGSGMSIAPMYLRSPGGTALAVLQSDTDGRILTVPINLVNASIGIADRQNGEENVVGPVFDGSRGAYWYTNHAEWHVISTRYDELNDIIKHCEQISLEYAVRD